MGSDPPLTNNSEISEAELRSFHSKAFHWALSLTQGDHEDAKEIMQKVYLKIYEGQARYVASPEASLKTWLFAVIKRTTHEHRRNIWKRLFRENPSLSTDSSEENRDFFSPESLDQRKRVLAALQSLPDRQKQIIELVTYHDLTVAEAARVMDVSLGSARTHYHRAKEKLRQLLKGELV